jgi:dUTP pyrophosphatase
MKIKIKKLHNDAVIPTYSKVGDAGMDLVAITEGYIDEHNNVCYDTGLAFEIPENYVGLLFPRSSNCKKGLLLSNSVGILDSGYRGSVSFKYKLLNSEIGLYKKGDRIGQILILPYPNIKFEEVDELTETERGNGGFGSTGR